MELNSEAKSFEFESTGICGGGCQEVIKKMQQQLQEERESSQEKRNKLRLDMKSGMDRFFRERDILKEKVVYLKAEREKLIESNEHLKEKLMDIEKNYNLEEGQNKLSLKNIATVKVHHDSDSMKSEEVKLDKFIVNKGSTFTKPLCVLQRHPKLDNQILKFKEQHVKGNHFVGKRKNTVSAELQGAKLAKLRKSGTDKVKLGRGPDQLVCVTKEAINYKGTGRVDKGLAGRDPMVVTAVRGGEGVMAPVHLNGPVKETEDGHNFHGGTALVTGAHDAAKVSVHRLTLKHRRL